MNNEFLLRFTDRLREKKWHIEQSTQPIEVSFNEDFKKRFPNLPEEFIFFVSRIESAVSEDEQSWFLCPKDYSNALPNAEFQWNQFEQISLEATAGDDDWASEIIVLGLPLTDRVVGEIGLLLHRHRCLRRQFRQNISGYGAGV